MQLFRATEYMHLNFALYKVTVLPRHEYGEPISLPLIRVLMLQIFLVLDFPVPLGALSGYHRGLDAGSFLPPWTTLTAPAGTH